MNITIKKKKLLKIKCYNENWSLNLMYGIKNFLIVYKKYLACRKF